MKPTATRCKDASDGGTAALVVVLAGFLVVAFALAAVQAVTAYAVAAARARTAADAAALAAMQASPLAGASADPVLQAEQVASANGAALRRVARDLWPLRVRVSVAVAPRTPFVARLVGDATSAASAQVDPIGSGVAALPAQRPPYQDDVRSPFTTAPALPSPEKGR